MDAGKKTISNYHSSIGKKLVQSQEDANFVSW